MARACVLLMNIDKKEYQKHTAPMSSHINVGSGYDITILELADLIASCVGFNGKIAFDHTKPDGARDCDSSKLSKMELGACLPVRAGWM